MNHQHHHHHPPHHNGKLYQPRLPLSAANTSPAAASLPPSPNSPSPVAPLLVPPLPLSSPSSDSYHALASLKLQSAPHLTAFLTSAAIARAPESSAVALSSSTFSTASLPSYNGEVHQLLRREPCAQSIQSLFNPASATGHQGPFWQRPPLPRRDPPWMPDLPSVCGPSALQPPKRNSRFTVRMETDDDNGPMSDQSKRLRRTLQDLARELLGDDSDVSSTAPGFREELNKSSSSLSSPSSSTTTSSLPSLSMASSTAPIGASSSSSSSLTSSLPLPSLALPSSIEHGLPPPLERDWTDAFEEFVFAESPFFLATQPEEQSSAMCGMSNSKHVIPAVQSFSQQVDSSSTSLPCDVKGMLLCCASAINEGELGQAINTLVSLQQSVSLCGDPMQRLGAYMAVGLAACLKRLQTQTHTEGQEVNFNLRLEEPSPAELLKASEDLYVWCPFFKFGYMAANGAIAEAFRNEPYVHIIDFDIAQGNQWEALLGAFSQRPGGPPQVRLTGISDSQSPASLEGVGRKLKDMAQRARVPFEFKAIPMDASQIEPWMLKSKNPGEALAVNFAFQLHHMPDESVSTSNPRDRLLRMVKDMKPKVVTLVEHEANTNTAPFYPRFVETLSYFEAVFESLDLSLARDSKDRLNAEQHCLARYILNIISCEGAERRERYELAGKWRARMSMAGFKPLPLSSFINNKIKELLQPYSSNYKLREELGALHLHWRDRGLIVASAWQ